MAHFALPALAVLLRTASARPAMVPLTLRPGVGSGERRRLSQVDEARVFGDLHTLMSYHVDVLVGTPGQMQSVIVDTGSAMTAFPCTECGANCGTHIDPPFDPQASSSFRWVNCSEAKCATQCPASSSHCSYAVNYLEGSSISGWHFEDVLHLGHSARSNSKTPVWLGCHTRETNKFLLQAPSGIMGLGEGNWDVLQALMGGPLERRVVGLCLSDAGGVMAVGGVNQSWTPLAAPLQKVSYGLQYSVSVSGASLVASSGQSFQVAALAGTYAMDSGSTFTYFFPSQYDALRAALQSACAAGACGGATASGDRCWSTTEAALDSFPELRIAMGQATYVWLARGYLMRQSAGLYCYTFYGEPPLTFGASFMRHHLVVFDREEGKIGFAPSPCPSVVSRGDAVPIYTSTQTTTTPPPPTTTVPETAARAAWGASSPLAALLLVLSSAAPAFFV